MRSAAGNSLTLLQSLEGPKCRAAFESFSKSSVRPSALQRQVAAVLAEAGWTVEEEVKTPWQILCLCWYSG